MYGRRSEQEVINRGQDLTYVRTYRQDRGAGSRPTNPIDLRSPTTDTSTAHTSSATTTTSVAETSSASLKNTSTLDISKMLQADQLTEWYGIFTSLFKDHDVRDIELVLPILLEKRWEPASSCYQALYDELLRGKTDVVIASLLKLPPVLLGEELKKAEEAYIRNENMRNQVTISHILYHFP